MGDLVTSLVAPTVVAVIVSGIFGIVTKWIDRKWSKGDKLSMIEKKLIKNEADSVRLQMLVLLADYPDDVNEILKVAQHYFVDVKGNWYMTSLFNRWLSDRKIAQPEWFNKGDK